jgi:AcrR family transcriptional regulator
VRAVGAHHQVGVLGGAVAQHDRIRLDGRDRGAEADLGVVAHGFVQCGLQVAAEHGQRPIAEGGLGDGGRHGQLGASVGPHQHRGEQAQVVRGQRRDQAEPLGGGVARPDQVHQVTAAAPGRRALHHQRPPPVPAQPQGGGQPGDARSHDDRTLHRALLRSRMSICSKQYERSFIPASRLAGMPRGVAIPDVRQQLFAAVERVIAAAGPGRLTSRAVTREAGVATGLLYAHFTNFDDFLAGYAVDRAFQISGGVAGLPERAGSGTVAGNLRHAVGATPLGTVLALTRLMAFRPELAADVEAVLGSGTAGLQAIERAVAGYLAAEQRLGRVSAGTDTEAMALLVVGALHHVALTGRPGSAADRAVGVLTGTFPATAP